MPLPTIPADRRGKLDAIIRDVVKNRSLPAIFTAVANADEIIYENQGGWIDYGRPEAGEVTVDTSALGRMGWMWMYTLMAMATCSPAPVLDDQVHYVGERRALAKTSEPAD